MSWSYRITILYTGFVALILTLVIISSRQKVELESKDYYKQELNYQKRLNALANASALGKSIDYVIGDKSITLFIPLNQLQKEMHGEVYFYCPASSDHDVKIPLSFDKYGRQLISTEKMKHGAYQLRLEWKNGDTHYYKESVITIR
ncbi:MAG: FixH family protein [Bacteroidia bacterium]